MRARRTVKLLATPESSGTCDYDLVGAMTNDFVMFGSGYAKLPTTWSGASYVKK